jgi:CRP/FNR family transcriptional regulator, cyclic AMP receptor protein
VTRQTPVRSASELSARLVEAGGEPTVRILETDPELGLRVPASQIRDARRQLSARVKSFDCGRWEVPHEDADRGGLGFLMLEGLLARDVILAGATSTELLGEGDVVQPWVPTQEDRLVRYHVLWHVLAPVRMAVIDGPFVRSSAAWPAVMNALFERAIRRAMRMSVHQALLQLSPIETRLLVLFWHLAERWGRVTPTGITLRLRLPHELLGQLVGSQRASVTTALRRLNESGLVTRASDGNWQLRGEPPDGLGDIDWHRSVAG